MASYFEKYFGKRLVTLDGGFGTTLEDVFHKNISHTPLWSAKPIDEDPEVIIQTHLAFLKAGAQVILTSTYQCAYETFLRAGYSAEDAERIMIKAVELAIEARRRYIRWLQDQGNKSTQYVKIALSLGPFGATLSPAQEFDGFYPPPYGPRAYSPDGDNVNTFSKGQEKLERGAVDALAQFHLQRLLIFARNRVVWSNIDCLAFETVPLVREVKAIRRAMKKLYNDQLRPEDKPKPWWISTVFPGGCYPQATFVDGRPVQARDVVEAVLGPDDDVPCPTGYGVNCTAASVLPSLLAEVQDKVGELELVGRPWLVLYPNGGDTYDPLTQTWVEGKFGKGKGRGWADEVFRIIENAYTNGTWEGIVAGGCCRTGPDEIQALAQNMTSTSMNIRS